jgi:hypothetical protein
LLKKQRRKNSEREADKRGEREREGGRETYTLAVRTVLQKTLNDTTAVRVSR